MALLPPPAEPDDGASAGSAAWVGMLRAGIGRLGVAGSAACAGLLSVLVSVGIVLAVSFVAAPASPTEFWARVILSAAIPALIAPPVVGVIAHLLFEAEAARQTAERLAVTDALTGAFNRRHFFECGEREFGRSLRSRQPLCVLLFDVDDFKSVNDRHGHATGDRVLVEVARVCQLCMRDYDLLARYGGEEFVALLPATDLAQAMRVAERVRAAVEAATVTNDGGQSIGITVSIGVAQVRAPSASFDGLLAEADASMYCAKRAGKNQVVATAPT
jgi:diguanylate cyclase (GGDEF)-like protein